MQDRHPSRGDKPNPDRAGECRVHVWTGATPNPDSKPVAVTMNGLELMPGEDDKADLEALRSKLAATPGKDVGTVVSVNKYGYGHTFTRLMGDGYPSTRGDWNESSPDWYQKQAIVADKIYIVVEPGSDFTEEEWNAFFNKKKGE